MVYIGIGGTPEEACIYLKRVVEERRFEPPSPWSRARSLDT
jgi:hypothetical protein